jgi:hypothetical protein
MTKEAVAYLQFFIENEEEVTWVLRQQEKLRLEYIMFLKKDLPDILQRQGIRKWLWGKRGYEESVRKIIDDYSTKIQTSIDTLSSELLLKARPHNGPNI